MTITHFKRADKRKITKHKIIEFFKRYLKTHHGRPPSLREVAEGIGGSPKNFGTVSVYMWELVAEGFLMNNTPGEPRSFLLAEPQPRPQYFRRYANLTRQSNAREP